MSKFLSPRERRSRLELAISDHVIKGYRVVEQDMTSAEMYKPKRFSLRGCLLGLGVFYLPYYALAEEEKAVYLEVTPQGEVVQRELPVTQVISKLSRES